MRPALLAFAGFLAGACAGQIERAIEDANYCTADEECVVAEGSCTFGCDVVVNVSEVAEINRMIRDYEGRPGRGCLADCPTPQVACEDERCVAY